MSDLAITSGNGLAVSDEDQLVTMTVDGQLFGIPILSVQDIVEPKQITPVPLATSAIAGVLNLRGRIVTVIDLRVCLGAEPTDLSTNPMSVTIEHKGDLYTILVDTIGDVRSMPRRNLDKAPNTLDVRMRRLCSGVFRLEDDLLAVLDVERVLDPATIADAPKRRLLKSTQKPTRPGRTEKPNKASASGKSEKANAKADKAETKTAKDTKTDKSAAATASKSAKPAAPGGEPSLYDRLGGELAIDAVVDLFHGKVMDDDRLSPFFKGSDQEKHLAHMKAFLAQAFGGPSNYKGKDMRSAHSKLVREQELGDGHFISVASHLADSLIQMSVPSELIDEVMTVVESVRGDVLSH